MSNPMFLLLFKHAVLESWILSHHKELNILFSKNGEICSSICMKWPKKKGKYTGFDL